jgi:5-methylthioadenosine/S-adenosylhomocysteine deaminase
MPDAVILAPQWIAPVAPDPDVLSGHAVLIEDGSIAGLGPLAEVCAMRPQAHITPLPGHLLTPGFVNLHTHAAMALLRGSANDMPLESWLRQRIWPLESRLIDPGFVRDGTLLAAAEMLSGGTTCFNDMYFFPDAAIESALQLGMRSVHGIIAIDFPTAWASSPGEYFRKGLAVRDRYRDHPLVSFSLAPHAPYSCSDETLGRVATLSGELGLPVHIHLLETASEGPDSLKQHGQRPLQRLDRLGLVGPELIAVHCVHPDENDLQLMAARGVSIAHAPHSNLKLANGIAPVSRMLDLGIRVGIGTDGSASNNRLDMIQEARTAALVTKGTSGRADAWPAREVLRAMTLDGAAALGLDHLIGSIEPGKRADLVAIDLSVPELAPVFDPIAQLVYSAGREHVQHVWIDGRHVVRKRQLLEEPMRQGIAELVARIPLWHNRVMEILLG